MAKIDRFPAALRERMVNELKQMGAIAGAPLLSAGSLELRRIVGCHAKNHRFSLAGSGDGKLYASVRASKLARGMIPHVVWDGKKLTPWKGPLVQEAVGSSVLALADEELADGSLRRRIQLVRDGEVIQTWDSTDVNPAELVLTRRFVVRLSLEHGVVVVDPESGKQLRRLGDWDATKHSWAMRERDELTIGDRELTTWDLASGKAKGTLKVPASVRIAHSISPFVVDPGGAWLCAITYKATGSPAYGFGVTVASSDGKVIEELPAFAERQRPNLTLFCGGKVLVGASDNLLRVWDTATWSIIGELDFTGQQLFGAAEPLDDRTFGISGNSGTVYIFSIESPTGVAKPAPAAKANAKTAKAGKPKAKFPPSFAKFSSTARTELVAALGTGEIPAVYPLSTGHLLLQYGSGAVFDWVRDATELEQLYDRPEFLAARPDGVYAVNDVATATIRVYRSGDELVAIESDGVVGARLCGDDLLVRSDDRGVEVFDIKNGKRRGELPGHVGYIDEISCAGSSETERIATCDKTTLRIWSARTLTCERVIEIGDVSRLRVKQAGAKLIAVTCDDGQDTVHVYATDSFERVARLRVKGTRMNVGLLANETLLVVEELAAMVLYDTATWKAVDRIPLPTGVELQCVTADGMGFVVIGVPKRDFLVFALK